MLNGRYTVIGPIAGVIADGNEGRYNVCTRQASQSVLLQSALATEGTERWCVSGKWWP